MADLEEILATKRRAPYRTYESDAARVEGQKRRSIARDLARAALMALHRDDYDDLYQQAIAKVDAERGPLPE